MYITNQLIRFIEVSRKLSNSTILLTDHEKIILVAAEENKQRYENKPISKPLKKILKLYQSQSNVINYMNTSMESIVPLVVKDKTSRYRSEMILPIVHDHVDGLLIFFVRDRQYLPSNLRFAKTTKQFVEAFSTVKYLE